jgi:multiple sugar transport system permease protein
MATIERVFSPRVKARKVDYRSTVRKTLRKPQFWFGLIVLVPTLLWYFLFLLLPMIRSAWMSVVAYQIMDASASQFVGIGNFVKLIQNPLFSIAMRNTLTWAGLTFLLMLPASLFVSVSLSKVRMGRNLYQAIIFVPVVMSLVAIALLFRMLMDPQTGQFNQILSALGLPESKWINDENSAMPVMVAIQVWKSLGIYVVILTAGLLNIPQDLFDSAAVDGANDWQMFWRMTLPLLGHTLTMITVLMAIDGVQAFTLPSVLTNGGPGTATFMGNMLIYQEAFANLRFGTATAGAILQLILILFITRVLMKAITPKWSY